MLRELAGFEGKARSLLSSDVKQVEFAATITFFYRQSRDWLAASEKVTTVKDDPPMKAALPLAQQAMSCADGAAAMSSKIFRDPLYNYVSLSLEKDKDAWLLKLLDTPEVQRLRRIQQLGVRSLTYPGAGHNRL